MKTWTWLLRNHWKTLLVKKEKNQQPVGLKCLLQPPPVTVILLCCSLFLSGRDTSFINIRYLKLYSSVITPKLPGGTARCMKHAITTHVISYLQHLLHITDNSWEIWNTRPHYQDIKGMHSKYNYFMWLPSRPLGDQPYREPATSALF